MCTQRCTHQQHRTSDTSQEYKHTIEIVLLNYVVERMASDLDRQIHNTKPHSLHGCFIRHHTDLSHMDIDQCMHIGTAVCSYNTQSGGTSNHLYRHDIVEAHCCVIR